MHCVFDMCFVREEDVLPLSPYIDCWFGMIEGAGWEAWVAWYPCGGRYFLVSARK